jgi:hypothetical protein
MLSDFDDLFGYKMVAKKLAVMAVICFFVAIFHYLCFLVLQNIFFYAFRF